MTSFITGNLAILFDVWILVSSSLRSHTFQPALLQGWPLLACGSSVLVGLSHCFDASSCLPPPQTNIAMTKNTSFSRKYIFKGSMFHCYDSLPECICNFKMPWQSSTIFNLLHYPGFTVICSPCVFFLRGWVSTKTQLYRHMIWGWESATLQSIPRFSPKCHKGKGLVSPKTIKTAQVSTPADVVKTRFMNAAGSDQASKGIIHTGYAILRVLAEMTGGYRVFESIFWNTDIQSFHEDGHEIFNSLQQFVLRIWNWYMYTVYSIHHLILQLNLLCPRDVYDS